MNSEAPDPQPFINKVRELMAAVSTKAEASGYVIEQAEDDTWPKRKKRPGPGVGSKAIPGKLAVTTQDDPPRKLSIEFTDLNLPFGAPWGTVTVSAPGLPRGLPLSYKDEEIVRRIKGGWEPINASALLKFLASEPGTAPPRLRTPRG